MEVVAPATWRTIDFLSDLHLQPGHPQTFAAWRSYLLGTPAQAIFILGDLFEVWVGDDVLDDNDSFERQCCEVLQQASQRADIFFLHGNRDFLLGKQASQHAHITLLTDPTILVLDSQRWLLTHGDAWCSDDLAYQHFRSMVRAPDWQSDFLSKPLVERRSIAQHIRNQSQARKHYSDIVIADAQTAVKQWRADAVIHGHTHQPGQHPVMDHCIRHVLSDWELDQSPQRADILRITRTTSAPRLDRLSLDRGVA